VVEQCHSHTKEFVYVLTREVVLVTDSGEQVSRGAMQPDQGS
jgi:uncharacterized cupin superfamily protein